MTRRRSTGSPRWRSYCAVILLAGGCAAATPVENDTPAWLRAMIRQMEQEPVANPPAYVVRYRYRGADVYYVPPRFADVPGRLHAADGTLICSPDGGITGRGDGRCPDFFEQRSGEQLVWRDPRGGA